MTRQPILIVDDGGSTICNYVSSLRLNGYQAVIVTDCAHALLVAHMEQPVLAIIACGSTDGAALLTCECLQSHTSTYHVPIMVIADKGGSAEVRRALRESADSYVKIPCDPSLILDEVRRLLGQNKEPADEGGNAHRCHISKE